MNEKNYLRAVYLAAVGGEFDSHIMIAIATTENLN